MSSALHRLEDRPLRGIVLTVLGIGCITLNDAMMKLVVTELPVPQAVGIRGLFAMLPITWLILRSGGRATLRPHSWVAQLQCAVLLAVPIYLFMHSLQHLPLSIATIIFFTNPLFVAVLAPFMLGERTDRARAIAVVVGFAGAAFVVNPAGANFEWVLLAPVAVALLSGVREMYVRKALRYETSASILFYSSSLVTLSALSFAAIDWHAVSLLQLMLLAGAGVMFTSGIYLMTEGLRFGDASLMAIFKYTAIVWSLLLGFALWNEVPDGLTWVGTTLIVASGIYTVLRQRDADTGRARPADEA